MSNKFWSTIGFIFGFVFFGFVFFCDWWEFHWKVLTIFVVLMLEAQITKNDFHTRVFGAICIIAIWWDTLVRVANDTSVSWIYRGPAIVVFLIGAICWYMFAPMIIHLMVKGLDAFEELIKFLSKDVH